MLAALLNAVRADLDRQAGWAREETRRQIRYVAVISAIATMAALAALGALIVGLIALHSWLTLQVGSFASLGLIGGGLYWRSDQRKPAKMQPITSARPAI